MEDKLQILHTSLEEMREVVGNLYHTVEEDLKPSIHDLSLQISCLEKKMVNTRARMKTWEKLWMILLTGGFVVLASLISAWR